MNFEESGQMQNPFQSSQMAALFVSLLKELRKEQTSNPDIIIMNERILAIESQLNNILQQNEYLETDNSKLQSYCSELVSMIRIKASTCTESIISKIANICGSSELKISDMENKISSLQNYLKDIKVNNDLNEQNKSDIQSLSEDNDILLNQLSEYKKILNQKEMENIKLQNDILEYDKKVDQLQGDYQEVEQKLIAEINKNDLLNTELINMKESSDKEKSVISTNLENKSTEISNLQGQLNNFQKENKNLQDQLINYKARIDELELSEDQAKKQLENERKLFLEQQISGENHSKELLETIQNSNNKFKDEIEQKDQEIKSLKLIQDNLQNEIELLKNSNKEKEEFELKFRLISDENKNLKNMQSNQNEKILELTNANLELANSNKELANSNKDLAEKTQNDKDDYNLKIKEIEQKYKEENQLLEEKMNGISLGSEIKQNEIDRLNKELEELHSLNSELTNELDNLKNENGKLTVESGKLAELTTEIINIRKSYDANLAELEQCKVQIQSLTEVNNLITAESLENKKKIDELSLVKNELETNLKSLKDEISNKDNEIQAKTVEIDLLRSGEKSKSKLNDQLIQSKTEVKKLNSEIKRLQKVEIQLEESQNLLKEKYDVEMQNAELLKQNQILLTEHDELVSIAAEFDVEIFDLKKFFEQTKSEKDKLEKNAEENIKTIAELKQELNEIKEDSKDKLSEYENVVESLNSSHLAEMKRLADIYDQKVEESKILNQQLSEKNAKYEKELADLGEKLRNQPKLATYEIDEEKEMLKTQLNEKNEENNNLYKKISELQEERERKEEQENRIGEEELSKIKQNYQSQIDDLEIQINGLSLKNEELESTKNDIEKNLDEVTEENNELINQINDTRAFLSLILGPLNGEIYDLRTELQTSADKVRQMKNDNRSLKFEVQRLNNEIIALNTNLDEKKSTVSKLEKKQLELEKASNNKVTELKSGISKIFEELEERRKHDDELIKIEQEKQQMLNDIAIFGELIYELNKQANSSFAENSHLRTEIIEYLSEIDKMKSEAQNADENIANLIQQVSEAHKELDEAKRMTQSLNLENVQLNEDKQFLNEKISSIENLNSTLKKENEKILMLNKELDSRVQLNSKEKEMIMKRLDQKQEVDEEIEKLRSKLNQTLKEREEYEKENLSIKEENKKLSEMNEKSKSNQTLIKDLEYEKLELSSRVSLLEGQLQLRAVRMKDSDIAERDRKIEELSNKNEELSKNLEKELNLNKKLVEENENIRSERDALDLKSSQLEANTASSEELKSALSKCEKLEIEAQKRESFIEKVVTERNSIDLKCEELVKELKEKEEKIEQIEQKYKLQAQNEEKLKNSLAQSELKSTKTNIENLQEKKETIKLIKRVNELEATVASMKNDKKYLEDTNKRQCEEIAELSQSIDNLRASSSNIVISNKNTNAKSPYKMISDKSIEITELKRKIKILESQLQNETADHLNTKKEMDKQFKLKNDAERKLRSEKTDLEGLVKALTGIFSCEPKISSIIAAASKSKGKSQFVEELLEKLQKVQDEADSARREPNYLKQQIKDLQMCLEVEKKKNSILEAKINKNLIPIRPIEKSDAVKENLSSNLGKCEICLKNFLHILIDSDVSSNDIQIAASNLLSKADNSDLDGFFVNNLWNDLSNSINKTIFNYRLQFSKMILAIEQKNNKTIAMVMSIDKNMDVMEKKLSDVSYKCRDILINQAKSARASKINKNINDQSRSFILKNNSLSNGQFSSNIPMMNGSSLNDQFVSRIPKMSSSSLNDQFVSNIPMKNGSSLNDQFASHIPKMNNSTLNDRQLRKPIQSVFQKSEFESNIPVRNNIKSNATPKKAQKKQETTPFRTPFGELSSSTLNISFGTETPKITMKRNEMSKIPIHYVPNGVVQPDSRNYH